MRVSSYSDFPFKNQINQFHYQVEYLVVDSGEVSS